jgi:type I restriction-modification system DNA methylase subunit
MPTIFEEATWKLARLNLAIRGIDANLGPCNADSFRADLHPDLKADFAPVRKDLATATRASAKTTLANRGLKRCEHTVRKMNPNTNKESRTLAALLPKLLSGELRVPVATSSSS